MTLKKSIFDLAMLVQGLIPFHHVDLEKNHNVFVFFQTMNYFGQIKYMDKSYNLPAVERIFRVFRCDIEIAKHYVAQLTNLAITKIYHPQFTVNMHIISNLINFVETILLRIDVNNLEIFASWRFLIFTLVSKCYLMLDQKRHQINLQKYQKMMEECGGISFSTELEIFYEIVLKIATSKRLFWYKGDASAENFFSKDKIDLLIGMLQEKEKKIKTLNPVVRTVYNEIRKECENLDGDPIDVLLTLKRSSFENLFEKFEFSSYKRKDVQLESEIFLSNIAEKKNILTTDDEIIIVQRNFDKRIKKDRKNLFFTKTSPVQEQKIEKKFPYLTLKEPENDGKLIVDQVESFLSECDKLPEKKKKSVADEKVNEKKQKKPSNSSPLKESQQHTPKTPEKKQRKQKYNEIWLRK